MMAQKANIDFSKYRTPELVESIVEILSLPGAFRSIVKWGFFGLIVLVVVVAAVNATGDNRTMKFIVLGPVVVSTGFVVGLLLGAAEFVRRSLNNMIRLIPKDDNETEAVRDVVAQGLQKTALKEKAIVSRLDRAENHLKTIGGWIRLLVLAPAYAILV